MQLRVSRFALAAVLLASNIWAAKACSDVTSAIAPISAIEHTLVADPAALSPIAEVEFAFPNWVLLADHEGDSFTSLSAAQLYSSLSDEVGESRSSIAPTSAPELSLSQVLVDDEGIPLLSLAEGYSLADVTGSTFLFEDEMALDGYEDR